MWDGCCTLGFSWIVYFFLWYLFHLSIRLSTILSWGLVTLISWLVYCCPGYWLYLSARLFIVILDTWDLSSHPLSMGLSLVLSRCYPRFAFFRPYIITYTHGLTWVANPARPAKQLTIPGFESQMIILGFEFEMTIPMVLVRDDISCGSSPGWPFLYVRVLGDASHVLSPWWPFLWFESWMTCSWSEFQMTFSRWLFFG